MKKDLAFILLLHLAITSILAYFLNIWADEASTLYTTENGLFATLTNALQNEKQAPFYFLILSIWREFSDSVFYARLFSIICGLLTITIIYKISRKLWRYKTAAFVTFFFAVHPFLIWTSLEIRVYALTLLMATLLIKFFFDGYVESSSSATARSRIFFILTSVFSIYTNYYLGFILVGCLAALVVLKKWHELRNYFFHMAFVGVFILPLLWAVKMQFDVNTGGYIQETSFLEGLQILWNHFLSFVLPTELFPPEDATLVSLVRVWLVRLGALLVVVLLLRRKKRLDNYTYGLGAIAVVVFAMLFAAYFALSELYIALRHAAVWFPPLFLFVASVIVAVRPKEIRSRYYFAAVVVLITLFYSYALFNLYPDITKRGDWARVGQFITENEKPGQPVIVFTNYEALALKYTYNGKNKVLPEENYFSWNYEGEFGSEDTWRKQIEYVISKIPAESEQIWLVTEDGCQTTDGCLPLENFVRANYTVEIKRDFYKERVRLLRKK